MQIHSNEFLFSCLFQNLCLIECLIEWIPSQLKPGNTKPCLHSIRKCISKLMFISTFSYPCLKYRANLYQFSNTEPTINWPIFPEYRANIKEKYRASFQLANINDYSTDDMCRANLCRFFNNWTGYMFAFRANTCFHIYVFISMFAFRAKTCFIKTWIWKRFPSQNLDMKMFAFRANTCIGSENVFISKFWLEMQTFSHPSFGSENVFISKFWLGKRFHIISFDKLLIECKQIFHQFCTYFQVLSINVFIS